MIMIGAGGGGWEGGIGSRPCQESVPLGYACCLCHDSASPRVCPAAAPAVCPVPGRHVKLPRGSGRRPGRLPARLLVAFLRLQDR
jgi:hypothetical protein